MEIVPHNFFEVGIGPNIFRGGGIDPITFLGVGIGPIHFFYGLGPIPHYFLLWDLFHTLKSSGGIGPKMRD